MAYNNPATSGVDMRPELLVRMVKESTGELSRMHRIDELIDGRLPLVLDALRAGAAGWCTAAPCLRPQPCVQAKCLGRKLFHRTQAVAGVHRRRGAGHHGEGGTGAVGRRRR